MDDLKLPLRQRQILNILQHSENYTTGNELAKLLHTTTRTIRKDISEINKALSETGLSILSRHRYGYMIESSVKKDMTQLTKSSESFLSREERIRYMVFRLFSSEDFINLDELADDMFVSKTTLELDLREFRKEFLLIPPYIKLLRHKNSIAFENDERKKRRILCHMYTANWDYNSRGNTFYSYAYVDEYTVNTCMREINYHMSLYDIKMEDVNLVHLDLRAAVMVSRISEGHPINDAPIETLVIPEAYEMTEELCDRLEEIFSIKISVTERKELCVSVSESLIPNMDHIREMGARAYFPSRLLRFADDYLELLNDRYAINLKGNNDFYITLIITLQNIERANYNLNYSGIEPSFMLTDNAVEFEIAFSIQPLARDYYGFYLDQTELFYLMQLISGALTTLEHPKLRTVLMFPYNIPVIWNYSVHLQKIFDKELYISGLLPVYLKDSYDFSDTDLILTSVDKEIITNNDVPVIRVSPYFSADDRNKIQNYLNMVYTKELYGKDYPKISSLLKEADWMENLDECEYTNALEQMAAGLCEKGYVDSNFITRILQREALATFTSHPTFIIVHAYSGTDETRITAASFKHRIHERNNKIRMIIMLSLSKEDSSLIFKFYNELYNENLDPDECRMLFEKEEYIDLFESLGY
ncbi:MAG: HTH domain-containing protein [Lachnospiraceae bacterium]|nr:HTH domain-containing protein [Lachnospiraceae bacterium]